MHARLFQLAINMSASIQACSHQAFTPRRAGRAWMMELSGLISSVFLDTLHGRIACQNAFSSYTGRAFCKKSTCGV